MRPTFRRGTEDVRHRRVLLLNWRDTGHPDGGGSEHCIEEIAQGLAAHGFDVTLRCAHYAGARHEEKVGSVAVVRRGGRFTVYPRAMLHLLVRPTHYDLVVDVQNGVPFWTRLVTRAPVIVLVHHVHRDVWPVVFGRRMARLGWWLESQVAPRVYSGCRYVTVSTTTKRELAELGVDPARVTVVYNGTDFPAGASARTQRTSSPSLLVLGRLVPHKRVELAIEALGALRKDLPDTTLTIVGRGYWEPELRALAARLGVSEAVTFTGFVDEETKSRLLAQSWVHVLPSKKEGWGLAVLDAAISGTPTVAFRSAGGTTESVIDGVTGVLLDDDDNLADQLAHLLRRPQVCELLGERARIYAGQFTWDSTVERFNRLAALAVEGDPTWSLPEEAPLSGWLPTQRQPRADTPAPVGAKVV